MFYASDYFDQLYEYAVVLIQKSKAYVDDLDPDQIREYRGTLSEPGKNSPFRERSVEENLDLFQKMKAGEFGEGEKVLRAKIDMGSGNLNMRDPILYRILKVSHHRTGNKWCVYPMYDFTHGQSDSIENITHSLCTLEFEDHRPLYDWFLKELGIYHPQQIEFARLNLNYTILSKRKLLQLVEEGHVEDWDDPRMPTIAGYRRRGFTASSIRSFCQDVGVTKYKALTDVSLLENSIRVELNKTAERRCAVLDPLEVIIDNYSDEASEQVEAVNNPEDDSAGKRMVPFGRRLFIEREDFMEDPPKKFFRLGPGREVRLRYAFFITCQSVEKDKDGTVIRLRCTYDPETRGGNAPDGRKVKATLHWVDANHGLDATVALYDRLFSAEIPGERTGEPMDDLNPASKEIITGCKIEPALGQHAGGDVVQFERLGYFAIDHEDQQFFHRTVGLRDEWAKIQKRQAGGS